MPMAQTTPASVRRATRSRDYTEHGKELNDGENTLFAFSNVNQHKVSCQINQTAWITYSFPGLPAPCVVRNASEPSTL